jgi:AraC family transcriptional regulator, arabinose operon regulatory protein
MNIRKQDGFENERYIQLPIKNFDMYLSHPLIENNYVTELGYYPTAKNHYRERFDGVSENILIYCIEGEGTIEIKNKHKIVMGRGSIFCIPANFPHKYFSSESKPWSILWIHFDSKIVEKFPIFDLEVINILSPEKNNLIQNHFVDLFTVAERDYSIGNMIYISNLLNLILVSAYYLDDGLSNNKQNYYLTRCIRYMNEHINENLTLSELAKYLNISPSYLSNIFINHTQKSPMSFFIQIKIEHACKLIRLTDLKMYEIGKTIGYDDPYYFSRIFKKNIGISPQQYKKQFTDTIQNLFN